MTGKFPSIILGFVFLVLINSCSTTKRTIESKKIMLSKNYYKSEDSHLLIKVPSGWNKIRDNSEKLFDFWLVSPNKNSTIVFVPIALDDKNNLPNNRITLEFLSKTTLQLKQSSKKKFLLLNNIQTYKSNNLWLNGFRYKLDNNERKSILFGRDNKFYECIAYFNKSYSPNKNELNHLFEIQSLVLSTVQIK